jgi:predicted GH43/DUF377 family glycosyl hydrolase
VKYSYVIGLVVLITTNSIAQSPSVGQKPSVPSSAWQVDSKPALTRGASGSWDEQGIGEVSVVRGADKWLMFYEGIGASETGSRRGFGLATSADATAWQKQGDQPAFAPVDLPDDRVASPSITRWKDQFWMGYLFLNGNRDRDNSNALLLAFRLARSNDGTNWREFFAAKHTPISSEESSKCRPCLYSDPQVNALELWWIGSDEKGDALFHSISRDGITWSKTSALPASEIDARPILCARVYPSGKFYILVYVAEVEEGKAWSVVTKVSDNARSWSAKGPSEFSLPIASAPWMLFTKDGARLFYTAHEESRRDPPDTRTVLRSAFCPKAQYEPR